VSEPAVLKKVNNRIYLNWFLSVYSAGITAVLAWVVMGNDSMDDQTSHSPAAALNEGSLASASNGAPSASGNPEAKSSVASSPELRGKSGRRSFLDFCDDDPKSAWDQLTSGLRPDADDSDWQHAAGVLVSRGGVDACRDIFEYEGPKRGMAKTGALMTLARKFPESFSSFFKEKAPPISTDLAGAIAYQLSAKNPQAALKWAMGLPDQDLSHDASSWAFRGWLSNSPMEASSWLRDNHQSLDADGMISSVIFSTRESDPAAALAWAERITNNQDQIREIERALIFLAEKNREEAMGWIEQANYSNQAKARFRNLIDEEAMVQIGGFSANKSDVVVLKK